MKFIRDSQPCTYEDAEEITQDSIIAWLEEVSAAPRPDGRDPCTVSFYFGILRNKGIDWFRKDARKPATEQIDEHVTLPADQAPFRDYDILHKAIDRLDEPMRSVVMLHLQGYQHDRIADVLRLASDGTSRSHLCRARRVIREAFNKSGSKIEDFFNQP